MKTITFTQGQTDAFNSTIGFVQDPAKKVMVIGGYAGTGKSTLVEHILAELPKVLAACQFMGGGFPEYKVQLTATTNKAVDSLQRMSTSEVITIHKFLSMRVQRNYMTGKSELVEAHQTDGPPEDMIVIVDEASYLDTLLVSKLFSRTKNCKFILLGDPAQLTAVGFNTAPAFSAGFETYQLTEVVRNGGKILELCTMLREAVMTNQFHEFTPDGNEVQWLDQADFNQAIVDEFSRPDWKSADSRFLAWQNRRVEEYNAFIRAQVTGAGDFLVGDEATVNEFTLAHKGVAQSLNNNQVVTIAEIMPGELEFDIPGSKYRLTQGQGGRDLGTWFKPDSLAVWKKALSTWRAEENAPALRAAQHWADLRANFAQTVNKSQGATYGTVFIDVGDIAKCRFPGQIARLLYVAASRATTRVVCTGDL